MLNRKWLFVLIVWALVGCNAVAADRQAQVAEQGAEVMPFDLERTTHLFEKLANGGLQQVVASDGDSAQIALIREHLAEEAARFSQGNFDDPSMIHGEDMAGLQELAAGADRLSIVYSDLDDGGQILYSTADAALVVALHAWFDQQLADHGEHAQAGSSDSAETNTTGSGMGMGMGTMDHESMRIAHHATVPDAYATLSNPISADAASLERGAAIYVTSCALCHGDGGMGDGPAAINLDPAVSPIAQTSQMHSDAYLFWRVSEGGQGDPLKSAMPAWKNTFDEQARWDAINYVQALGKGTVQPQHSMGGAAFDPAAEQQSRLEMLAEAKDTGLIDQTEADTFTLVHAALDDLMAETGLRMQGNNMPALLSIVVERSEITDTQTDTFIRVHDLLIEAGLMH
jgi:mono/diheme cytochrome c family protein